MEINILEWRSSQVANDDQQPETLLSLSKEGMNPITFHGETADVLKFALTHSNGEQLDSVLTSQESEIAYWRRQYNENYEAASCAQLNAFAITSPHEFITKRMENMSRATMELTKLVGNQETARLLSEAEHAEETISTEPSYLKVGNDVGKTDAHKGLTLL